MRLKVPCASLTISYADMVELVDTHALGACASRREGSSPFIRTRRNISSVNHASNRLSPDEGGSFFVIDC